MVKLTIFPLAKTCTSTPALDLFSRIAEAELPFAILAISQKIGHCPEGRSCHILQLDRSPARVPLASPRGVWTDPQTNHYLARAPRSL